MSLPIEIQNGITRFYSLRQNEAARILQKRRSDIEASIPEYKRLSDELSQTAVSFAKQSIRKGTTALEKTSFKEKQAALGNEIKMLLEKNGYPADYLDEYYFCKECKDTGMIGSKKCHCYRQFVADKLYKASNLPAISYQNFDTFDLTLYPTDIYDAKGRSARERMRQIRNYLYQYATSFSDENANSLLLCGDTGSSKTFLCSCIAKVVLDAGFSVLYLSAYDVYEKMHKSTWSFDGEEDTDYSVNALFDCDLLIIDDLGTEPETSHTSSYFFRCINERLTRNHSTIISTNHSVEELKHMYTQRVVERIISTPFSLILTTKGMDFNIRNELRRRS